MKSSTLLQTVSEINDLLQGMRNLDYRMFVQTAGIDLYIPCDNSELKAEIQTLLSQFDNYKVKAKFFNQEEFENSILLPSIFDLPVIHHTGLAYCHSYPVEYPLIPQIEEFLSSRLDKNKDEDYCFSGVTQLELYVMLADDSKKRRSKLQEEFNTTFKDYDVFFYIYTKEEVEDRNSVASIFERETKYGKWLLTTNFKKSSGKKLTIDLDFSRIEPTNNFNSKVNGFVEYWVDSLFSKTPVDISHYINERNANKKTMSTGNLSVFEEFVFNFERIDFNHTYMKMKFCNDIVEYCTKNNVTTVEIFTLDTFGLYYSFVNTLKQELSKSQLIVF